MTDRRDVRTEQVIQRSQDLQEQLLKMADELMRYVHALQVETETERRAEGDHPDA